MRKPTISICENKDADQKLISFFVYATWIVQSLFLNPKFQASSRPVTVCVRPVRKPHCWFSHDVAQVLFQYMGFACGQGTLTTHSTVKNS